MPEPITERRHVSLCGKGSQEGSSGWGRNAVGDNKWTSLPGDQT